MRGRPRAFFLASDFEASQALGEVPGNVGDGGTAPVAIGIRQPFQQLRCCAGERDLQMERQRFFFESCHAGMRTNIEHFVNRFPIDSSNGPNCVEALPDASRP